MTSDDRVIARARVIAERRSRGWSVRRAALVGGISNTQVTTSTVRSKPTMTIPNWCVRSLPLGWDDGWRTASPPMTDALAVARAEVEARKR
jgi:hypothetical protein